MGKRKCYDIDYGEGELVDFKKPCYYRGLLITGFQDDNLNPGMHLYINPHSRAGDVKSCDERGNVHKQTGRSRVTNTPPPAPVPEVAETVVPEVVGIAEAAPPEKEGADEDRIDALIASVKLLKQFRAEDKEKLASQDEDIRELKKERVFLKDEIAILRTRSTANERNNHDIKKSQKVVAKSQRDFLIKTNESLLYKDRHEVFDEKHTFPEFDEHLAFPEFKGH